MQNWTASIPLRYPFNTTSEYDLDMNAPFCNKGVCGTEEYM